MNPYTYCIISKSDHRGLKKGARDQANNTDSVHPTSTINKTDHGKLGTGTKSCLV